MSLTSGLIRKAVSLLVLVLCLVLVNHGHGQAASGKFQMAEPSITVAPEIVSRVYDALFSWRPVESPYYAITDVAYYPDGYIYVSVAGVRQRQGWDLFSDATWLGTVVLWDNGGAVLEQAANVGRDPMALSGNQNQMMSTQDEEPDPEATITFDIFPWEKGKKTVIGPSGVHAAWNGLPGWLAMDFLSGNDLGDDAASDYAYSVASGKVTYVCRDANNAAVLVDTNDNGTPDVIYVHLVSDVNLSAGTSVGKGQKLGRLRWGTFPNLGCGHADQVSNHWHLHFGFPNTQNVQFEDCTLNISSSEWECTDPSRDDTYPLRSWFYAKWPSTPTGGGSVTTLRENFWFTPFDGIINGVISLISGLPVSDSAGVYASDAINYAIWVTTIVWLVTTLHFNMTLPIVILSMISVLEIARWTYTILLMGKKLIPGI